MSVNKLFVFILASSFALQSPHPLLYGPNPSEILNRLHQALLVRQFHDRTLGNDELDPLLWRDSRYLLLKPAFDNAISVLDEFLKSNTPAPADLVQRAVLQSDLWAVFDWAAEGTNDSDERRALQTRLAKAIHILSLHSNQIALLPDNYADAVSSHAFASEYRADNPRMPFLPPDLCDIDGPWVEVSVSGGGLTAAVHAGDFGDRSVFRVFIRLPEGRRATLDYLDRLGKFPRLWEPISPGRGSNARFQMSGDVPQFPPGTAVALVRQMIVIDDQQNLTPTKLTQSVQLRVYRRIGGTDFAGPDPNAIKEFQDFFEFKLTRERLFLFETGGLHAVTAQETEFPVFQTHGDDMLEMDSVVPSVILNSCTSCHFRPGVQSLLSLSGKSRSRPTLVLKTSDEALRAIEAKRSQQSWQLLTDLWASPSHNR
jgi:hypothetical protein